MIEKIKEAVVFLKAKGVSHAKVGVVLGTGLNDLVTHMEIDSSIDYSEIPNFPLSTVEFHKGKLISGSIMGVKTLIMQGRFHFYEGYSYEEITFPIRVMKFLGVENILLSNAAGGINPNFKKGDLVAVDDHINLLPGNPLIGKNYDELGDRFPDMSQPYSAEIIDLFRNQCKKLEMPFKKGVYAAVSGPNLETRAEYRFLWTIGADMVGMSTVPEVIVCNHMKLPCFAVSVITDECDPDNLKPINISEIISVAGKADKILAEIFKQIIKNLEVS